jgi:hypothetical protein
LTAAAAYQRCFITLELFTRRRKTLSARVNSSCSVLSRQITAAPDELKVVLPIRDILPFPCPKGPFSSVDRLLSVSKTAQSLKA